MSFLDSIVGSGGGGGLLGGAIGVVKDAFDGGDFDWAAAAEVGVGIAGFAIGGPAAGEAAYKVADTVIENDTEKGQSTEFGYRPEEGFLST